MFAVQDLRWHLSEFLERLGGLYTLPCMRIGDDRDIRCTRIRERRNLWIPMRDGIRLCADATHLKGSSCLS